MAIQTTYTQARANLATLWDRVTQDREVVIIERRGADPVALISADELEGLMETAYLFGSPRNAERLLEALAQARRREGTPQTIEELAARVSSRARWVLRARLQEDKHQTRAREAVFHPQFREDLRYFAETDRKVAVRALKIVEEVVRDPFTGIGKPEALKHAAADHACPHAPGREGLRVSTASRVFTRVYLVSKDRIDFLQARFHY